MSPDKTAAVFLGRDIGLLVGVLALLRAAVRRCQAESGMSHPCRTEFPLTVVTHWNAMETFATNRDMKTASAIRLKP
jgi:hypothetical protein